MTTAALLRSLVLLLCLAAAGAMPARAEMRALLVAVSEYPTLEPRLWLRGPRNDAQRLRAVLQRRGFAPERIQLLADGVPGAALPTRANILAALKAQAQQGKAGDFFLLYMGGHGSQQPADPNTPEGRDEADGLSETFLPADVGRWDGSTGTVRNAIADHELRQLVDQLLDRGVFVWAIFDACHSATLVRDAPPAGAEVDEDLRFRQVAPADLGVPVAALREAAERVRPAARSAPTMAVARGGPARGGAVYFYAAQTTERTPEMRLPRDHPQRQPYGLFSFVLTQLLDQGAPMSYAQLAQAVLSQYGAIDEARVTPLFGGTALAEPVLGQRSSAARQWPVGFDGGLQVAAGALSGVQDGAVFALLPGPLAPTEQALGLARAHPIEAARSALEPLAQGGKPAPNATELSHVRYARLLHNPVRYALRVAVDARGCPPPCAARAAVQQLQAQGVPGADISWVPGGADLTLRLLPTRIALMPAGRAPLRPGSAAAGVALDDGTEPAALAARLAPLLHQVARSTNLVRLAARLASDQPGAPLAVSLQRETGPLAAEKVAVLGRGERVQVRISNPGPEARDVTVLYVDAAYGVEALYPKDGAINRLEAGATAALTIDVRDGAPGPERLLVLAVPAQRHGERVDLSFVAQPSLPLTRALPATGDPAQAFRDAAFATFRSRGVEPQAPLPHTEAKVYTFDVRR